MLELSVNIKSNLFAMQQALSKYLVIGSGQMASHFCHYLKLLNISHQQWARNNNSADQLQEFISDASHILLLIKDSEIIKFYNQNANLNSKPCIHFSGSVVADNIFGAHPLMTFGKNLYLLKDYQKIPFILEDTCPDFHKILPGLPNKSFRIPKQLKGFYHALCVLSSNFSCILWQKFFSELQNTLHLPIEIAKPYLEQTTKNLLLQPEQALTGPLMRNDLETIEANLNALKNDPFCDVYKAMLKIFKRDYKL
jgi:hypothetical protein